MKKHCVRCLLALLPIWGLSACANLDAQPSSSTRTLLAYFEQVEAMDAQNLAGEYAAVNQRHDKRADPADSLRLAYLLSRPGLPEYDLHASLSHLDAIDGSVWPLKHRLMKEIALMMTLAQSSEQIAALKSEVKALRGQLDTLKSIDDRLSGEQGSLDP